MKLRPLPSLCAALLALCPILANAQTSAVPNYISYQGRVVDATGDAVGAGTPVNRTVIFRIWDNASATSSVNLIYSEEQTVTILDGMFSVLVGQGGSNPTRSFNYDESGKKLSDLATAFDGSARYLGVTVATGSLITASDGEIIPRQQIVSTAYAMRAKFAESIGSSSDLALNPLSGVASDNGLGWYGTGRLFSGVAVNGPVLYGYEGGALGSNNAGSQNAALQWDANGRVGIGTSAISSGTNKLTLEGNVGTTPADQLTIRGASNTNKQLLLGYDTTNNKATLQSYSGSSIGSLLLLNPKGGNVQIGENTNSANLMVNGGAMTTELFTSMGGVSTSGSEGFVFNGGTVRGLFSPQNGSIALHTNNTEHVRVISNGNVGIGTTIPGAKLEVADGAGEQRKYGALQITRLDSSTTGSHLSLVKSGSSGSVAGLGYLSNSSSFGFGIGSVNVFSPSLLTINPTSGNVGINKTNPSSRLHVAGTANVTGDMTFGGELSLSNSKSLKAMASDDNLQSVFTPLNASDQTIFSTAAGGFIIKSSAGSDLFKVGNDGYIQAGGSADTIGVLNLGAKTASFQSLARFQDNGVNSNGDGVTGGVSISASGYVNASRMYITSDRRVKKEIQVSDGSEDLQTLMGIEISDYRYIDELTHGSAKNKKVIAQQVESVYPQAVSKNSGVMPDVYKKALVRGGWVELETDLKVGEKVELVYPNDRSLVEVLEVKPGAFRPNVAGASDEVFVYGRQVEDFRQVDYDAIAMLNVSATQELVRELEVLRRVNQAMQLELDSIKSSQAIILSALQKNMPQINLEGAVADKAEADDH
jgi:hypothetical protein